MDTVVVRVCASTGQSTALVSRLARALPTEPGAPGELFWMFLRRDAEGDTIDLVGLLPGGNSQDIDADAVIETIQSASGTGLLAARPRLVRRR